MSEIKISDALRRTLPRLQSRADPIRDQYFESGQGTRAAVGRFFKQSVAQTAELIVGHIRHHRPVSEERQKEVARRRTWAGGGNMPAIIRAVYSEAERAALSVIAAEFKRRGFCGLSIDEIARLAGVSRTSVQNALRKARSKQHGHISVRERPQPGGKNLTNIIKIVCKVWLGWIARAIGFKRLNTSETPLKKPLSEGGERPKFAFERERVDRSERQSQSIGPEPAFSGNREVWR